jgi:hypothetical protein
VQHRAVRRRSVVIGIGATAGAAAVGGIALSAQASDATSSSPSSSPSSSSSSNSLVFDPDAYTELTTTVTDTEGTEHSVKYHFWKAITYVAKPVDEKYQSLNVSVPVEIDGTKTDASNAPILFANSVGGYMPSSVADATGVGGGGMSGGMPGGGAPSARNVHRCRRSATPLTPASRRLHDLGRRTARPRTDRPASRARFRADVIHVEDVR